jgi:propanediol utilization protein
MDIDLIARAVAEKLFVEVEASGRHVHVTKEQAQTLFGHDLTPVRELSQPGQYLAKERVTVVGPKGEFQNVAVLGPARKAAQVEISLTDGRALGIDPPVRLSGRVEGSPGAVLVGSKGQVSLNEGVICAQRHIHMTPEDATRLGIRDGDAVKLKVYSKRPVIFEQVPVRISKDFQTRVHLDFDEANACGFQNGDLGRILQ